MRISHCVAVLVCFGAFGLPADAQSSAQVTSSADTLVAHYCAAWSTVDEGAREALLEEVWAENGEYVDPRPVQATGRAAITAQILEFQHDFPGSRFRCSAAQAHHGFVRYAWVLIGPDGTEGYRGTDFGEINPDGQLVRLVSFFDAPPPAS